MAKKNPEKTFEQLMEQVEEAAEKLENGEVALEEAISVYEEGMKALKQCYGKLERAERRVKILLEGKEEDFDTETSSEKEQKGRKSSSKKKNSDDGDLF
jgi:exodeoxyribonuclease VII small subunit